MTRWLSIVGLGEDGLDGLAPAARDLVAGAEVLVGGERHLKLVADDGRERWTWSRPLSALVERIAAAEGRRVCVLATGDPMWFGIGTTLLRRIPAAEVTVLPAPSAFSLACARLGWSLPEVETVTLHGRPLALLAPLLSPGARIVALSNGGETPGEVAGMLVAHGYGDSRLTVLEHMGGPAERRHEAVARDWDLPEAAALNTLAIECRALSGVLALSRQPGLPDEAFEHDGQLTKREVRAATLAALQPLPGGMLWDIGAGCGSVAIEWLRTDPRMRACAVEPRADRRDLIARNAAHLGTPFLCIVDGAAPEALSELDRPDAVFVGGGISATGVMDACWQALPPAGRLVANAVTLSGEGVLADWHRRHGGALSRIQVSRARPLGAHEAWQPAMPVTQLALVKP